MEKYETLGRRFVASIIDSILIGIANWVLSFAAIMVAESGIWMLVVSSALNLLAVFYFILLHTYYGQTLGKKIVRVKVVDDSETPINFGQAVIRSLPQLIPALFMVSMFNPNGGFDERNQTISYIIFAAAGVFNLADIVVCLSNNKRRALHDFIAGTIVVKTDI